MRRAPRLRAMMKLLRGGRGRKRKDLLWLLKDDVFNWCPQVDQDSFNFKSRLL